MKKSINLENTVSSDSGIPIAFFNARISIGYENINLSMNVVDEKNLLANTELFKREFDSFIDGIKNEAINNGWEALKEQDENKNITEDSPTE